MDATEMDRAILDFIREPGDFEAVALRLFAYQYAHNAPYRQFCLRRRRTPATVSRWQEIPPVPIAAFKELDLACEPAAFEFRSSGTTGGERRSRHLHASLDVWDASMEAFFARHILHDGLRPVVLALGAAWSSSPHSSFSRYFSRAVESFGAPGSGYLVGPGGLDAEGLAAALRRAETAGTPVLLTGPSFAFVHWFDACSAHGWRFRLPAGSRMVDGGGTKGLSRDVEPAALYRSAGELLGIPLHRCINEYGATELSSELYDRLGPGDDPAAFPRVKVGPPWLRTRVLDPETLAEVTAGESGLLCHYDLANRNSVLAVLTEDLGRAAPGEGVVFLGRLPGAEARGCSLAMDELLGRGAPA